MSGNLVWSANISAGIDMFLLVNETIYIGSIIPMQLSFAYWRVLEAAHEKVYCCTDSFLSEVTLLHFANP